MRNDDDETQVPQAEPEQQETEVTATAKKTTSKKKTAAPKKTAAKKETNTNGSRLLLGKYSDEAVFEVDLEKSKRRQSGDRFEHLKRLDGKKVGNVKKTDWFRPELLRKDMKQGSLKIRE